MNEKADGRGRPKRADKASTTRVVVQMTDDEKQSWKETAKEQGMTLSDWIRQLASQAQAA